MNNPTQNLINDLAATLEKVLLSYRNGVSAMGPEDMRNRMALVDRAKAHKVGMKDYLLFVGDYYYPSARW